MRLPDPRHPLYALVARDRTITVYDETLIRVMDLLAPTPVSPDALSRRIARMEAVGEEDGAHPDVVRQAVASLREDYARHHPATS